MKKNKHAMHATRVIVTNAIASAMLLVYGRSAYAGTCVETPVASGNWVCSGAAGADVTQPIGGTPVTVTTSPGFGITVAAGNALNIFGNGGLTFTDTNASVISGSNRAIYARNDASGSLNITTNGTLSSGQTSIVAFNFGTGSMNITTSGTVNSTSRTAIYANNAASAADLTINAADLTGGLYGIVSRNSGTGATTITTTGTVTGTNSWGIYSRNNLTATDLTINAADVNAGQLGIFTRNFGVGSTNITATGTVWGINGWGIYSRNDVNATDLTINAVNVSGGQTGIDARNYGTGETSVTSTGMVIGVFAGINARNSTVSSDMTINAYNIFSENIGIRAINSGTGELTINTTGSVTAHNIGIYAQHGGTGNGVSISANDVSGTNTGIHVSNVGNGVTTVTTTGTVSGGLFGIDASGFGSSNGMTIDANNVVGGNYGIRAVNFGSGDISIASSGTVSGSSVGIYAVNVTGSASNLAIDSVDVQGGSYGIRIRNNGSGSTTINSTGTVTGYVAIQASSSGSTTELTINTVDVNGDQTGIFAGNTGIGATSVTSTGTVIGSSANGIFVRNYGGSTTDLTVTAVDVSGGENGIRTLNFGTGETTITSTGTVIGTADTGIEAFGYANTTDMTISVADVTGYSTGINTFNIGSGAMSITSTGTITGTFGYGMNARNDGTDMTINIVDLFGGVRGMQSYNFGTGSTDITSTGTVASYGIAIHAFNAATATDLTITANDVSGEFYEGIIATNYGSGATSITTTGVVSGGFDGSGIYARNMGVTSTDLSINAVDVSGGLTGIVAFNFGSGATTITSTGTVIGTSDYGIFATNANIGDSMTISSVDVTGGRYGIVAINNGNQTLTITSTGTVTGTAYRGIFAQGNSSTGDMTVVANNVNGGQIGIDALNFGGGALNVTSTGSVTGTQYYGIYAHNITSDASDLTVTSVDVAGGVHGIDARNNGRGTTTVTSTGTVTGSAYFGIYATSGNGANAINLNISANNVSGGQIGILARNYAGSAIVTTTGTITGIANSGISVTNWHDYGDMTVSAVNVSGGTNGIIVDNGRMSTTNISVTGDITGGSESGINTITNPGSLSIINLSSTSSVSATSGNAITNNVGDSVVNVSAGAIITGAVRLNGGSDTFNVVGSTNLGGITALDGGDDTLLDDGFVDVLNLNTAWSGNLNGANILNWEFININGGTVGFSNAAITAGQINVNNFGSLNGSNNLQVTGGLAIASGSRVLAGNAVGTNAMSISGNLFNAGSVQLTGPAGQQAAGDILTVGGNYIGANGQIVLDTVLGDDASLTDTLVIAGNASGSTGITVNNVGGLGAVTTGDGILLVDVGGTSTSNAFSLNNQLEIGAFNYYLYQNGISNPADGDWYLRSAARGITSPAMAIPDMGNKASLSILGSLQERMAARDSEKDDGGAWIRVVGNAGQQTHQSSIGDFSGRNDSHVVQAGIDLSSGDAIRWGVFGAKTQSTSHMFDLSIDPDAEVGAATVDGYALGAYATHYGDTFYWDAVLQHAWLDAAASGGGDNFETDSKNWLASFEFGGAFKFGNGVALEPQVQVIIGKGSTADAADSIATYDYSDEDLLLGRLGVRWSQARDEGSVKGGFAPFLKLNVWRNFGDDSLVNIGPSSISTERNDTWMELGAGFSVSTGNNWSIFMQYDYEKGMGQSDLENHTGTLGLRRSW